MTQAQAHIDAIKAKAQDDLAALTEASQEAKLRVQSGISDLRERVDPEVPSASEAADTPMYEDDERPTVAVDMPDELSFTDFDPGAPELAHDQIEETQASAPAVSFNSADAMTDEDGIPLWEDPA